MKKLLPILTLVAAAAVLVGCLPSIHPFYTPENVIFDGKLIGSFSDQDTNEKEKEVWQFRKADGEENAYRLEMQALEVESGKVKVVGEMVAHLFRLEGKTYLDLRPDRDLLENEFAPWYQSAFIPGHLIFKAHNTGDRELELSAPHFGWIEKRLKAHPDELAHVRDKNRFFLTATTAELQAWLLKHDGELWEKPEKMFRRGK